MSVHMPLEYFPFTAGKLKGWGNVTEHINKSPLDWSLKSKATTLNLSRRSFTLISCFLFPSLFISPPLIFIPVLTYHLFFFLSFSHLSLSLSPSTVSFFCERPRQKWIKWRRLSVPGEEGSLLMHLFCQALHGRPTGSLDGGFLSHLSDVGQSGMSCPDGYINVERMLNITL